jgi:hypothetical protein
MGRGQQQCQAATGVAAEERRPPRPDGRHHATHVVHLVVEGVPGRPPVGQTIAQPVEQDQPGERRQLVQEAGERRVLPDEPQVGGPPEQEDEVQVALAHHLVGEPASVLPAGELEGRAVAHAQQSRR